MQSLPKASVVGVCDIYPQSSRVEPCTANQRCISGAQLSTASGLSLVMEPIDLTLLCANDSVSLPAGQPVLLLI